MQLDRRRTILLLPLAVLLACSRSDGAEGAADDMPGMAMSADSARTRDVMFTAAQVQHGGVQWEPAVMSSSAHTAVVPGTIVPDEDRTARLGAPARGRIIAVAVRPGDRVTQGQVLVTLHSPEAAMAQSDAEKAQAELASRRAQALYAKSARDRSERLLALKAIPRQDYERAVADDELARAAQAQAEAELRRATSTAEQLAAGTSSGEIALRAPSGGVVLSRTALPGAVVEAGSPLITVTSRLWLTVDVPEQYARLLRVGSSLQFTVPAYAAESFSARIDAVGAGLDPQTRTLPVRAGVLNRNARLRPEMLASVTLQTAEPMRAVLLPVDAVQSIAGKNIVFIAMPNAEGGAHLMARDVEVGVRSGGKIAVTQGVQAGELVVTRGAFGVKAQLEKAAMPKMEM
ncbi:MAG: efflux RND transporter periplasmic adaptor subunit [Longimicrobiales bacterium]